MLIVFYLFVFVLCVFFCCVPFCFAFLLLLGGGGGGGGLEVCVCVCGGNNFLGSVVSATTLYSTYVVAFVTARGFLPIVCDVLGEVVYCGVLHNGGKHEQEAHDDVDVESRVVRDTWQVVTVLKGKEGHC